MHACVVALLGAALSAGRCDALHVVVAGATGKVGREVVRVLARQVGRDIEATFRAIFFPHGATHNAGNTRLS